MQKNNQVAVIGGTGKAGRYLVNQLVGKGISVRLLLRDPSRFYEASPLIECIHGDARNPDAMLQLIDGSQAVMSTLGQPQGEGSIFSDPTGNVIRALAPSLNKRYILITGLNVDTPMDRKGSYAKSATKWMKSNYPETTTDKQREWEMLVSSNLDWTLVRLPLIELTEQESEINVSLEDCPGTKINAGSLAAFLIKQLKDETYLKQSPFIANR